MKYSLIISLVIGSLSWYSAALPQPQDPTGPSPADGTEIPPSSSSESSTVSSTTSRTQNPALPPGATSVSDTPNVEEIGRKLNMNHCVEYYPENRAQTMQQCADVCGSKAAEAAAQVEIPSIMCLALDQPWQRADGSGGITMEQPHLGSPRMVSGGNCTCNDPFMSELAVIFIEALPLIADIGCQLLVQSSQIVAELGAAAIPGVGQAINAGMIAGIQAAKLAKYAFEATSEALDAFGTWVSPCGPPPDSVQTMFDVLGAADPNVIPKGGWKPPPGLEKGGGKGN